MTRLSQYLNHLQRFGIVPGLERIRALLELADQPHHRYPVVLVGGTNGKGSTAEFLARLLAQSGLRSGLYTSPHLYRWNERIRVLQPASPSVPSPEYSPTTQLNADCSSHSLFPGTIDDEELDSLFAAAQLHLETVAQNEALGQPTEFETLTFLGAWHFARAAVDVAVVEVGLGGKWDATNALEPQVSVITHVALDHCDRLGSTLEEIARDKVHIARPGKTLVSAETKTPVRRVFQEYCDRIGATLEWVSAAPVSAPLEADFQAINLATARAAHRALGNALGARFTPPPNFTPGDLSLWTVPGRFETLCERPTVIIDGANNPDGAQVLAARLREQLRAQPDAQLILVLGILDDKDWRAMTRVLAPLAGIVIVTQSSSSRAASPTLLAREAAHYAPQVEVQTPVAAAVRRALELAGENDVICITGSFYTIAEVER